MHLLFLKNPAFITFIVGCITGLIFALSAEKFDHITTTDQFCTSCHAMKMYIADTEVYQTSVHRTHASGVQPGCADCHIPKGLVISTYTHIIDGVSDLWGQLNYDYEDPVVWEKERGRLAYAVRDTMRKNDSVTCRSCHTEALIKPQRKRGQKQHEIASENGMTCIDCHYNLVHEAVEPRDSFLNSAGEDK